MLLEILSCLCCVIIGGAVLCWLIICWFAAVEEMKREVNDDLGDETLNDKL